jgi:hypothetical protein
VSNIPPVLEDVATAANKAADWLAALTRQLDQEQNAPHDINDVPIIGDVRSALEDVHRAAQLKDYIPLAIIGVCVLVGRPWIGLVVAVLVYMAGQEKPAPAAGSAIRLF